MALYFACAFLYETQPALPPAPLPPDYYYVDDTRFTIFRPNSGQSCNDICAETAFSTCDNSLLPNNIDSATKMNELASPTAL